MTGVTPTAPPSAADRLATALGWTPGQVWTVALGLALAIPAGIFGLGPALDTVAGTAATIAAPAPVAAAEGPTSSPPAGTAPGTAPDAPPLRTPLGRTTAAASGAPASAPTAAEAGPVGGSTPPPVVAGAAGSVTIPGPGEVRAVAAAADAVVVAVDRGAGAPGSVVVVDDGGVTAAVDLVVDGITHHGARGIAADDRGVLVTTASPAAVLRVDPVAGAVEAVATIPDLPMCVPVARETGCQPGAVDAVPEPGHLTVGPDGTAYVVDRAQACVFRIDGDTAAPWLCDLAYTPSPADTESGLRGIASADDAVVLTARLAIGGRNVVHHVAIEDGEAGERRQVADLEPAEEIGGATVLGGGRIAVALAAPGVVLVISPDDPGSDQRLSGFTRPADIDVRADELFVVGPAPGGAGSLRTRDAPAE